MHAQARKLTRPNFRMKARCKIRAVPDVSEGARPLRASISLFRVARRTFGSPVILARARASKCQKLYLTRVKRKRENLRSIAAHGRDTCMCVYVCGVYLLTAGRSLASSTPRSRRARSGEAITSAATFTHDILAKTFRAFYTYNFLRLLNVAIIISCPLHRPL